MAMPHEAMYQHIVEQVSDGIVFADREGIIRVWNGGAEAIFGHTATEAIGQNLDIIIPERFRDQHWKGYDAALASGKTKYARQALVTRSMRKDGATIYVELTFALLKDQGGVTKGAVAAVRDVTARFAQERALRQRITELEKQLKP